MPRERPKPALQTLAKYGDIRCCSGGLRPPVFRRSESAATTNDRHHNLQTSIGGENTRSQGCIVNALDNSMAQRRQRRTKPRSRWAGPWPAVGYGLDVAAVSDRRSCGL